MRKKIKVWRGSFRADGLGPTLWENYLGTSRSEAVIVARNLPARREGNHEPRKRPKRRLRKLAGVHIPAWQAFLRASKALTPIPATPAQSTNWLKRLWKWLLSLIWPEPPKRTNVPLGKVYSKPWSFKPSRWQAPALCPACGCASLWPAGSHGQGSWCGCFSQRIKNWKAVNV